MRPDQRQYHGFWRNAKMSGFVDVVDVVDVVGPGLFINADGTLGCSKRSRARVRWEARAGGPGGAGAGGGGPRASELGSATDKMIGDISIYITLDMFTLLTLNKYMLIKMQITIRGG